VLDSSRENATKAEAEADAELGMDFRVQIERERGMKVHKGAGTKT
jgi:hypothetical protein